MGYHRIGIRTQITKISTLLPVKCTTKGKNHIRDSFNVHLVAHLHTVLRTEENMSDLNCLKAAKEPVKLGTWGNYLSKAANFAGGNGASGPL